MLTQGLCEHVALCSYADLNIDVDDGPDLYRVSSDLPPMQHTASMPIYKTDGKVKKERGLQIFMLGGSNGEQFNSKCFSIEIP